MFHAGLILGVALAGSAGCGGSSSTEAGAPPPRRGEVWAVEGPADDAAVPGAIVAFVNGMHVMVMNGDRIYAGMSELQTKTGAGDGKTVTFPSGLTADLVPSGEALELRFSSGERVTVKERTEGK
jgi:hypothetical protein